MSTISEQIKTRQDASFKNLKEKRVLWDSAERLFHGQLADNESLNAKSQVFDPKLSTLTLERAYRVMAQLQTGKVIGVSKNDEGDAKLKNLVLERYVIPNATAQFDFLTKMRMMDIYSNIYGNFFSLTDWDVKKNGYIGPDVWLLNIRDVFPQVGAVSVEDSDHIIIRTWKSIEYFKSIAKQDGFKNVAKIITKLQDKSGSKDKRDSENISKREEREYPDGQSAKNTGFYEVFSQFEGDRWVDFCVDADMEFRDSANPHDNGELPIDCKYSIPLLDDFMGMGDFERGGSLQKAINSTWNMYLDAVKMSIFPPININKNAVAAMSSLRYEAAAKWLSKGPQAAQAFLPLQLNPQGISTFNNTYQVSNAAMLNLFGTTDTTTTSQTDANFGRTPQAIQHQMQRENTRDNADRFYMEQYITKIMKKMVNLLSKKQSGDITVRMFKPEIEDLARSYPEVADMYDEKTGKLSVKKGAGERLYDYEIVSGSTYAVDQKTQQDNLAGYTELYLKSQGPQGNLLKQALEADGYQFNFGEMFKMSLSNSGIQDWDKILIEMTPQERSAKTLNNDAKSFMQALQQAQAGAQTGSIPPTPNGQQTTQPMNLTQPIGVQPNQQGQ